MARATPKHWVGADLVAWLAGLYVQTLESPREAGLVGWVNPPGQSAGGLVSSSMSSSRVSVRPEKNRLQHFDTHQSCPGFAQND
jgi:hypothetical protein